jgi:hypothetical protein
MNQKWGGYLTLPKSLRILVLLLVLLTGYAIYQGVTNEVDKRSFTETITGINKMVEFAQKGNIEKAEQEFNRVHGFFHDVDPTLREHDPTLAEQLWDTVTLIEAQYGISQPEPNQLVNLGEETLNLLLEAQEKLK